VIRLTFTAALIFICLCGSAHAKSGREVVIADPYIELHTGPGSGYPIFYVADRGEQLIVSKRRTNWYKVQTQDDKQGWVSADQLARTLDLDGEEIEINLPDRGDYLERKTEVGFQIGDFDGANAISVYVGYLFNKNLSMELWGTHLSGDFSSGWMTNVNLVHQSFPSWFVSPYFLLGTGLVHIEPKATLVQAESRTDQEAHVGFGLRSYLNERFLIRAEFRSYVVLTERDSNEEADEWKVGFAFFF
jgi:hypothetical protein